MFPLTLNQTNTNKVEAISNVFSLDIKWVLQISNLPVYTTIVGFFICVLAFWSHLTQWLKIFLLGFKVAQLVIVAALGSVTLFGKFLHLTS